MEKSVGLLASSIFGSTEVCLSSSIKEVLSTIVVFTIDDLVWTKLLSFTFIELSNLFVKAERLFGS